MATNATDDKKGESKAFKVLVAVDFSPYSGQALKMAKSILGRKPHRIVVLHVIDHNFIDRCIKNEIRTEDVAEMFDLNP